MRGSILRGVFADTRSPLAYGFQGSQIPVYFNQDPVLNVSAGGGFGAADDPIPGVGMNVTPMATASQQRISPYDPGAPDQPSAEPAAPDSAQGGGRGGGRGSFAAAAEVGPAPRIVLQFPSNAADMLLSGTLSGGQALANRAQLVDVPLGQGHVVAFAIRPFWRWQTQGTYCLAFNAILNWNDLDAGRPAPAASRGAPAAAMNSGGARGCE